MTRKSLDYIAGLFDGEGSFSIQVGLRRRNGRVTGFMNPSMSMTLYYGTDVFDDLVEHFGGTIYPYKRGGGKRWHLGKRALLVPAAEALAPRLEIKADIAQRFLYALSLFPATGTGANRRSGQTVWSPERVIEVAEIALALNPPRSRKCNKTMEYIEELRAQLSKEPIQVLAKDA